MQTDLFAESPTPPAGGAEYTTIRVTQAHIDRAAALEGPKARACDGCPIFFAMEPLANGEIQIAVTYVWRKGVLGRCQLPREASKFSGQHHLGKPVQPIEFRLDLRPLGIENRP